VVSDEVAKKLENASGKFVELRYKEYLHALPWRGMSRYVVTQVLRIEEQREENDLPY
jgi:hypothetical protein